MRVMDHTPSSLNADRLTPEERDSQDYAELLREYGQDPEFMDALARAWRLGFHRHHQLGAGAERRPTINPFWR